MAATSGKPHNDAARIAVVSREPSDEETALLIASGDEARGGRMGRVRRR